MKWKQAWANRPFRIYFLVAVIDLLIVLYFFTPFLGWAEERKGFVPNDTILALFRPVDLSLLTFSLTYLSALAGIVIALIRPLGALRVTQAYTFLLIMRMGTMALLPLEPPATIIPLDDWLLRNTFYQGTDNLKDLFFSGHTATMFLFFFMFRNKWLRVAFFAAGTAVGILLIAQHVHYTIDVFAAPLFAYLAVRIPGYLEKMLFHDRDKK